MFNYHTVALISHASKVMLKILQARLQLYINQELPDVQAGFRTARRTRDHIANICWIIKKKESSRKASTSGLLTTPKPLTVWITTNWKILKETGIPDHPTCCLRNPHMGQETTVRTLYWTNDWLRIEEGVWQSCLLPPYLFNLYTENIMRKPGWMSYKLESRLPGEMSRTSDMWMTPL